MKHLSYLLLFLLIGSPIYALNSTPKIGIIHGIIKDINTDKAIEYATISVYNKEKSKLIDGTITNENGFFEIKKLKAGNYYIEVSFIGYEKKIIPNIVIRSYRRDANLNIIRLSHSCETLGEVVVNSNNNDIEYKIDKKIIPVNHQLSAAGGTAIDVLETVPSVSVDVNGNVSLRGSTGFTVLIDGRPTFRSSQEVLNSIMTDQIENIEIITNPSAKYNSEGDAGIINIISKKFNLKGVSGILSLSPASHENFSSDAMFNLKKKKSNLNFGANYNINALGGKRKIYKTLLNTDPTSHLDAFGDMDRKNKTLKISGAYDLEINPFNSISITSQYGNELFDSNNDLEYDKYVQGDSHSFENGLEKKDSKNNYFVTTFNYLKKFSKKGHQLNTFIDYTNRQYDSDQTSINTKADEDTNQFLSTFSEDAHGVVISTDYTLPLSNKTTFETGYEYKNLEYDSNRDLKETLGSTPITHPEFQQTADYNKITNSIYSLYSSKLNKLNYQLGLRAEHTHRHIQFEDDSYKINRWDFFPSIHTQLKLNKTSSLSANYSRRIKRPSSSNLEPFLIWNDRYNWTKGNPDLKPEHIKSFELDYNTKIGKQSLYLESYYRMTEDKIEHIKTILEDDSDIILSDIENVGKDYTLGFEASLVSPLTKWLKNILITDISHYKVEGEYMDTYNFSNSSTNWSLRNISYFTLNRITQLQLVMSYKSKSKWAQGEIADSFKTTLALKHSFFKKRLAANLTITDVFNTADLSKTYTNEDLILINKFDRDAPTLKLSLSYKFNNYKSTRRRRSSSL
ncbi:TonB-dependent receptor [Ancylomarina sp. 16SWW S1-10-2]|uniref:TonB-dependent receptor domain-containing protein n=1 Tax=Ancylomarina sp. 16SWW S1-10-2 TaxID=2499681 RepID=UPI00189F58F6|nr:TonB-dependent receptor [Ancylomarina sp. 16SWW S1-10-2]